jgi:hypothetical protein
MNLFNLLFSLVLPLCAGMLDCVVVGMDVRRGRRMVRRILFFLKVDHHISTTVCFWAGREAYDVL